MLNFAASSETSNLNYGSDKDDDDQNRDCITPGRSIFFSCNSLLGRRTELPTGLGDSLIAFFSVPKLSEKACVLLS